MFIIAWLAVFSCAIWASALSIPDGILQRELATSDVGNPNIHGNMTHLRLSDIGFTQDSIASFVRIHKGGQVEKTVIKTFLEEAKAQGDMITYFNAVFPYKIQVFYHTGFRKYLSIDNRRLCIFKATLGPTAEIEVEVFSQPDMVAKLGQEMYNGRITTKNRGESVVVRQGPGSEVRWVCPPTD